MKKYGTKLFYADKKTAIITKETFCKCLAMIQEQESINEQFSKALNLVGNGHFVYGTENRYLTALLLVLKESVKDRFDYIGWWLYETSDYMVWSNDEKKEWCLKEPGALYDFIVNETQIYQKDD